MVQIQVCKTSNLRANGLKNKKTQRILKPFEKNLLKEPRARTLPSNRNRVNHNRYCRFKEIFSKINNFAWKRKYHLILSYLQLPSNMIYQRVFDFNAYRSSTAGKKQCKKVNNFSIQQDPEGLWDSAPQFWCMLFLITYITFIFKSYE